MFLRISEWLQQSSIKCRLYIIVTLKCIKVRPHRGLTVVAFGITLRNIFFHSSAGLHPWLSGGAG